MAKVIGQFDIPTVTRILKAVGPEHVQALDHAMDRADVGYIAALQQVQAIIYTLLQINRGRESVALLTRINTTTPPTTKIRLVGQ